MLLYPQVPHLHLCLRVILGLIEVHTGARSMRGKLSIYSSIVGWEISRSQNHRIMIRVPPRSDEWKTPLEGT